MTKVILINGPARSGKDTLSDAMHEVWIKDIEDMTYAEHKFAKLMHDFWQEVFFSMMPYEEAWEYTDGSKKSEVHPLLGISYREGMISMSEGYIKPLMGDDFFGRFTAANIAFEAGRRTIPYVALVSDSGFQKEAVSIIEKFGAENVLHIKLYRPGYSFTGDSRNYIDLTAFEVETVELENTDLETFKAEGCALIREFVER